MVATPLPIKSSIHDNSEYTFRPLGILQWKQLRCFSYDFSRCTMRYDPESGDSLMKSPTRVNYETGK